MSKAKEIKASYITKAQADMQYAMMGSPYLTCDKCKSHLGIWHCIRRALFKKKWAEYEVDCKECGFGNKRIKGALGQEFNNRWD